MLKSIQYFTKYEIIFVAEGEIFKCIDEDMVNKFKKFIICLQNIDDRFIVEWNNIRVFDKNEQKIKDYILLKNSKNNKYNINEMVSLNLNENGVSITGDNKNLSVEKEQNNNSNGLETLFNNNDDK